MNLIIVRIVGIILTMLVLIYQYSTTDCLSIGNAYNAKVCGREGAGVLALICCLLSALIYSEVNKIITNNNDKSSK